MLYGLRRLAPRTHPQVNSLALASQGHRSPSPSFYVTVLCGRYQHPPHIRLPTDQSGLRFQARDLYLRSLFHRYRPSLPSSHANTKISVLLRDVSVPFLPLQERVLMRFRSVHLSFSSSTGWSIGNPFSSPLSRLLLPAFPPLCRTDNVAIRTDLHNDHIGFLRLLPLPLESHFALRPKQTNVFATPLHTPQEEPPDYVLM